jgi:hypothetical protein
MLPAFSTKKYGIGPNRFAFILPHSASRSKKSLGGCPKIRILQKT